MTVQRTSQAINLTPQYNAATVPQTGASAASPNVAEKRVLDQRSGEDNRLLQSILGDTGKLMNQGFQAAKEEAYMQGAAAAASGKEEKELDTNIMTADWAVGGYRDTSGRLKIAEAQSKLNTDMLKLREQSPEQMQEYLAQRRAELAPHVEGMTRAERTATFGKMLLADQSAITTHANEHRKFIGEQLAKPIQAENSVVQANLTAARLTNDPKAYQDHVNNFMAVQYATLNHPRLTPEVKEAFVVDSVKEGLANGNIKVYSDLRGGVKQILADGTEVTSPNLLGQLSMAAQEKLSIAHNSALQKADAGRMLDLNIEKQYMEAEIKAGTYTGGIDGVRNLVGRLTQMDASKDHTPLIGTYLEHAVKTKNEVTAIAGIMSGDPATVRAAGHTQESAFELAEKQWVKERKSMPEIQALANGMVVNHGNPVAAKYMGRTMDALVAGLTGREGALPQESSIALRTQMDVVNALEADGKSQQVESFLSGMSPEGRVRFDRMRLSSSKGDVQGALNNVLEMERIEKNMTKSDKAARIKADDVEHVAFKDDLQASGAFMSWVKSISEPTAAAMAPKISWFSKQTDNGKVTAEVTERAYSVFSEEYAKQRMLDITALPEVISTRAKAAASTRALQVDGSALFMPLGKTPQAYFGVQGYNNEQYAEAVRQLGPKTNPQNRMVYGEAQGNIWYQEYDKEGAKIGTKITINRQDVIDRVTAGIERGKTKYDEAYGTGKAFTIGGKTVAITGRNTASASPEVMLDARSALIKFEGYNEIPKPDLSGKKKADGTPVMVAGIGVTNENTYYPKVGIPGHNDHVTAFLSASNEAATNAVKFTTALSGTNSYMRNPKMQQLVIETMYQSGSGTVTHKSPEYKAFYSNTDATKAVALFKETPAYKASGAERQRHYVSLVMDAMPITTNSLRQGR